VDLVATKILVFGSPVRKHPESEASFRETSNDANKNAMVPQPGVCETEGTTTRV